MSLYRRGSQCKNNLALALPKGRYAAVRGMLSSRRPQGRTIVVVERSRRSQTDGKLKTRTGTTGKTDSRPTLPLASVQGRFSLIQTGNSLEQGNSVEKYSHFKVGPLRRIIGFLFLAAALAAVIGAIASSRAVSQSSNPEQSAALRKIAPWVTEHTAGGKQAEFMIVLADQADLSGAAALKTKKEKGRFVRDALWNRSQATHGPVLKWLTEHGLEHRSFYIVNAIWVKGRYEDAMALALRPDISRVEGNPQVRSIPDPLPAVDAPAQTNAPHGRTRHRLYSCSLCVGRRLLRPGHRGGWGGHRYSMDA